jgi:hypothetical protein
MFISFIGCGKGFSGCGTVLLPHNLKQPSFVPALAAFATLVVNNAVKGVPAFTIVVELRVQRPLQWSSSDELHEFHPGTQPHTALYRGCGWDDICQLAHHQPFAYGQ